MFKHVFCDKIAQVEVERIDIGGPENSGNVISNLVYGVHFSL